jgi:hypothetical protein
LVRALGVSYALRQYCAPLSLVSGFSVHQTRAPISVFSVLVMRRRQHRPVFFHALEFASRYSKEHERRRMPV